MVLSGLVRKWIVIRTCFNFYFFSHHCMEDILYQKPSFPRECHHMVRYGGNNEDFIKDILSMNSSADDIDEFFTCSLCWDCAIQIFIQSNKFKHFHGLCTRPKADMLHILTQILAFPQIYRHIKHNKKAFLSFMRLTISAMICLTNSPTKGSLLIVWGTILEVLLSPCCKQKHLEWIMELNQAKYLDEFGNNLWTSFIIKPFQTFIKYAVNGLPVDARCHYANWICLHIITYQKQLKFDFKAKNRRKCMRKCIKQVQKLNYCTESIAALVAGAKTRMKRKKYLQYACYYDDVCCNNKECNVPYLLHKFGVSEYPFTPQPEPIGEFKKIRTFYLCSGCKMTYYCSKRCQKQDWNVGDHKEFCYLIQHSL
eukprot:850542_1